MNNPLVAIVVLNYNGSNYLKKFLPFVLASTYTNKVVYVADNASTDDSVEVVKQAFPSVQLILLDENYGFAGGYNKALAQVQAEYFVLLNSDVEVTNNWIEPIIAAMDRDAGIAACQPKILSFADKEYFEYAGACGGWLDTLGYAFSRGRVFDVCEKDAKQYNDVEKIFWASGAAMFVKAEVYKQMGGLDSFFFAHMEEIDLCWRMQLAGYAVVCCPASVVYHVGGGTLPKGNSRKVFLNFRNNLIMMAKNLPLRESVWKLPLRVFLDIIFAVKNLFEGQAAPCKAVFKAHWALLVWMFKYRVPTTLKRKALNRLDGVYKGSIVWQYFVASKTRFSEIVKKKLP